MPFQSHNEPSVTQPRLEFSILNTNCVKFSFTWKTEKRAALRIRERVWHDQGFCRLDYATIKIRSASTKLPEMVWRTMWEAHHPFSPQRTGFIPEHLINTTHKHSEYLLFPCGKLLTGHHHVISHTECHGLSLSPGLFRLWWKKTGVLEERQLVWLSSVSCHRK